MDFENNDFIVRVRPMIDNTSWEGHVDVSIITGSQNDLDDESYGQLMYLCKMICAAIPILENDENLCKFFSDWVDSNLEDTPADYGEKEVEIVHEKDNLIRLNFGTPTKGSA